MTVPGWCRVCKRFRPVRVTTWRGAIPDGVCDECDEDSSPNQRDFNRFSSRRGRLTS